MRRKSRWTSPTLTLSISTDEATVWLTKPSPICRTAHGRFSLIAVLQCRILHCLESYALNCFRFEPRWLESLSKLKLPIQLLWGDSDAVSPMSIPRTLATLINPDYLTFTIFPDTGKQLGCTNWSLSIKLFNIFLGHFLTLEKPELWIDRILKFVSKHHLKLGKKHIWSSESVLTNSLY